MTSTPILRQHSNIDLASVSAPLQNALGRLQQELGLPTRPNVPIVAIHEYQRRPERRIELLRVELDTPDGRLDVFIKSRDSRHANQLQREYELSRRLHACFNPCRPRYDFAECISYYEDLCVLVTRTASGTLLDDEIRSSCRRFLPKPLSESILDRSKALGQWLRRLEDMSCNIVDANCEMENFIQHARKIQRNVTSSKTLPGFQDLALHCMQTIERSLSQVSNPTFYLAHGDLYPYNVLITTQPELRVTVIDAEDAAPQPAGFDALKFEFYVNGARRYRRARIEQVLQSFLEGYERELHPKDDMVVALRAYIMLNHIGFLATTTAQWPSWKSPLLRMEARAIQSRAARYLRT